MNLTDAYLSNGRGKVRETNDFYPTPPIGTLSLLKNHKLPKKLWEPAAGRGHISKELIRNGHEVISTDLNGYEDTLVPVKAGVDFMTSERQDVDGVITNPPFKGNLPEKLVRRMLEDHEYKFLALFCRLTFLESARRYQLFKDHEPARIYILSERVNCHERYFDQNDGLGGMVAYAWFVWDDLYRTTKGRVEWVKPSDYVKEL